MKIYIKVIQFIWKRFDYNQKICLVL